MVRTRTWKSVKAARLTPAASARVKARVEEELRTLTLKELRNELAVTQAELAANADMTQSELSRLESREDHRVSSLRRYIEALGGEIEIAAIIGGRRVKLSDV
ncbi:MAG TPA: helix-turn-helix domain-containing protein [Polyangiaceae bacterium]|nr:helix-turn-helix domain-containing protein [Polyangiaceae bacterium]